MNEPEDKSADMPSIPAKDSKKKPVSGAVLESRPVASNRKPEAASTGAKPQIASTLVGKPDGPGAASKRVSGKVGTDTPAAAAAAAATGPVAEEGRPYIKADSGAAPAMAAKPVSAMPSGPADAPVGLPPQPPAETRVEIRRAGFLPMFLGGIVAAGLGAAATYWAIPNLPPSLRPAEQTDPAAALEAARQAGTEAARAELATQGENLSTRAAQAGADAALQALADATPKDAAPVPEELNRRIAALETSLEEIANRPAPTPAPATPGAPAAPVVAPPPGASQEAFDALAARVGDMQSRIDELAARPVVDPATAEQVQTLARQAEELQQSTAEANRRAQAATAASALQAAIEANGPRDKALADLSAAGVEVPAVLTGEVPRLDQLRAEFPAAAREALRLSLEAGANSGSVMQSVGNFLRVQTGARSVEPREGTDPDAVLSRANAAVEAGDIAGALAEIGALPESGQQAMAGWATRAGIWVEANAALTQLSAGSR